MSNRFNSSNRTRSSSTEVRDSFSTPRRRTLGPFVYTNNGRTGICSAVHGTALVGILQLAGAHPTGLIGMLGHSNRSSWFQNNTTALFQADGPLGMFKEVSPAVLAQNFAVAQGQAKEYFDRNHSADQTGAAHKDVPPWASQFFCLFEALQNVVSVSAQAAVDRSERRSVVAGLTGCQAPLGSYTTGQHPVQLRSETSWNIGTPRMRQMHMGNVNVEVLGDETMNKRLDKELLLVEGIHDAIKERPARWRRTNSGV